MRRGHRVFGLAHSVEAAQRRAGAVPVMSELPDLPFIRSTARLLPRPWGERTEQSPRALVCYLDKYPLIDKNRAPQ